MVDLPLPEPKVVTTEQPKSAVTSAVFNRPLPTTALAQGMEQLGAGAEDLAGSLAREKGQADAAALAAQPPAASGGDASKIAVTLDASNQPQIATPLNSVILGKAGEEYQAAFLQGGRAAMQSKLVEDVADLRTKFPDAQGFKAAYGARADAMRQMYPGALGNALANEVNNLGAQHYTNIIENDITRQTRESLQAIQTNIGDTTDTMKALARQGAINTPQWDQLSDRLQDNFSALGDNKLFGYSPEKIASDQAHAFDELNGQFVVGRVDDTFTRKGKAAALDVIRDQIDNNEKLQLSEAERNQLHNYAISRLSYLSQEQQSNLAALRPTVELQVKALQAGNNGPEKVSEQEISQTLAQLRGLGAFKEAEELQGAQIVANRTAAFRNLSPDQKAQALLGAAGAGVGGPVASGLNSEQGAVQYFVSKGWSQAQAAGIVGNLIRESRLNTGALNRGDGSDGSDSIGIGQWNGSRAAALRQFAASQGKPLTDFGTQLAFVQHELETSEGKAAQALRGAKTPEDAAAAFALGYERPQGFQTGDISKVAGGQDRVDQARRLAGGGASSASIASGTGPGVTTLGQPFTEAEAQANPWLRTAYRKQIKVDDASQIQLAKNQFEALQNSIKYTGNVGPDIIAPAALALQIADRFPDKLGKEATDLRGALAGKSAGFAAAGGADQGGDLLTATEELARHGDPLGNAIYKHVQEGVAQGRKLLDEDQFEYARQAGWIPSKPIPLNFADPAALQQGMAGRAVAAAKIASNQYVSGVGAFAKNELPQVKDIAANGTPPQKLALMTSIVNAKMTPGVLRATLVQLGADPKTSPLAVAGDVSRYDRETANAIITGQSQLATEPKLLPKEDFGEEFAKRLPFNDLPEGVTRQAYLEAAKALYANKSALAEDTGGMMDQPRMNQAVEGATGGVREWRGSKVFAPWPGATQDQFTGAIAVVKDKDLVNAVGSDGVSLPASSLQPSVSGIFSSNSRFRLESAGGGEGKYFIFSGPDQHDQRQYLVDKTTKRRFVLDLSAKKDEAIAYAAGPLSHSPFSETFASSYLGGNLPTMGFQ